MAPERDAPPIGPRLRRDLGLTVAAVVLALLVFTGLRDDHGRGAPAPEAFDVTGALAGEGAAAGFRRVTGPAPLDFPADHGPHPDYRHEWWYVTGNVATGQGRHFGFQVTLFRFSLVPEAPQRDSALATNQLWMGHLAVTDTEAGVFHHRERFARGAAGLAGGRQEPFRVWLEDWVLEGTGASGMMPLRVRFPADGVAVDVTLTPRKPLVLQGDRGYSRKGPQAGNASRYYSYTRLDAEGHIAVEGRRHAVSGRAWMDREWGTSTLGEDQVGWDWFALQLDDGRDVMVYRLRERDGGVAPESAGVVVAADGTKRSLARDDMALDVQRRWRSPEGTAYPVAWRLRVPSEELDLALEAVLDAQQLDGAFRYWEGALRVRGADGEHGRGYAELTGYDADGAP